MKLRILISMFRVYNIRFNKHNVQQLKGNQNDVRQNSWNSFFSVREIIFFVSGKKRKKRNTYRSINKFICKSVKTERKIKIIITMLQRTVAILKQHTAKPALVTTSIKLQSNQL